MPNIWFLLLIFSVHYVCAIKLCNNFWSYSWSFMSNECYDDPNSGKNISEIIRSWGFTAEEHYLTTDDGYKLLVERAYGNITQNTPIIMVHGMMANAMLFVMNPQKSLTWLLSKLGYDVWLLNHRGTKYSRGHVNLTTDQKEYWKFTIDHLGVYDIRTTLKYVNNVTKNKPIYLGYSLGTTGFFVYSTTFPEEAQELLKGAIAFTPVTNWRGTKTPARFLSPIWSKVKSIIDYVYNGEVHSGMRTIFRPLLTSTPGLYILKYIVKLFSGDGSSELDPVSLPTFFIHVVDSTGVGIAAQCFQIYESGIFHKYDYGPADNLDIYGTQEPPAYDMSKVSVPVAIFSGGTDVLSTKTNCEQIYDEIQPSVRCGHRVVKNWGHLNFVLATDVVEHLYLYVIDKIEDIELGRCEP